MLYLFYTNNIIEMSIPFACLYMYVYIVYCTFLSNFCLSTLYIYVLSTPIGAWERELWKLWQTTQPTDRPTDRGTDKRAHREVLLPTRITRRVIS